MPNTFQLYTKHQPHLFHILSPSNLSKIVTSDNSRQIYQKTYKSQTSKPALPVEKDKLGFKKHELSFQFLPLIKIIYLAENCD